ncbi:DUF6042 family protein [Fontibacillus sp. BL9]|uniref:DUF6042 family protein n=1 Tax=Fontibacillus sp. BL9 TaxID=3389971 RepID=UPI00397DC0AD
MKEKVTVRSLIKHKGIDKDFTPVPTGLFDNGWMGVLPVYDAKLITTLAHLISMGLTKSEVLEKLDQYMDKEDFNTLVLKDSFETEEEGEDFLVSYQREFSVKERLEMNGYSYPSNIEEALALFLEFNILMEIVEDNVEYFDLAINPFPNPVDYFDK